AMKNKGVSLSYLDRKEDAIKAFDALIQKFGNETDIAIKQTVAEAMRYKSIVVLSGNFCREQFLEELYRSV
ncbi:MAG: hypothetical protein J6P47_06370, partial [Acetobacter sp.]|nr:hypothetical protein [Acetobacter sp.]